MSADAPLNTPAEPDFTRPARSLFDPPGYIDARTPAERRAEWYAEPEWSRAMTWAIATATLALVVAPVALPCELAGFSGPAAPHDARSLGAAWQGHEGPRSRGEAPIRLAEGQRGPAGVVAPAGSGGAAPGSTVLQGTPVRAGEADGRALPPPLNAVSSGSAGSAADDGGVLRDVASEARAHAGCLAALEAIPALALAPALRFGSQEEAEAYWAELAVADGLERKKRRAAKKRSEAAERDHWRGHLHAADAAGLRWDEYRARIAPTAPWEPNTIFSSAPAQELDDLLQLRGDDLLFDVRRALWEFSRERVGKCGRVWVGDGYHGGDQVAGKLADRNVEVWGTPEKSGEFSGTNFRGLMRCGSKHECPVCMARHLEMKAEQITKLVEDHERRYGSKPDPLGNICSTSCVLFLTNTVRHKISDDGQVVRDGLSRAWAVMTKGRPWERFAKLYGIKVGDGSGCGGTRRIELTHSNANGWHPHSHALLFIDHRLGSNPRIPNVSAAKELADMTGWFAKRWKAAVLAVLGEKHVPDNAHGTVLTDCHKADYLSKLGLNDAKNFGREMSSYSSKDSGKGRSPMQIGVDFSRYGRPSDALLWMEASDILRNTQMLPCFGDVSLPDLDAVEYVNGDGLKDTTKQELIATVDEFSWNRVRDMRFAPRALLKAARGGRVAFEARLAELLAKAPPADVALMRRERQDMSGLMARAGP